MVKGQPPKDLLGRRTSPIRKSRKPRGKKFSLDWKYWTGLLLTLIALWLAVEDRPVVSVGPPTDTGNIFSTPLTVVNNGVLPIRNVSFVTFVYQGKTEAGTTFAYNIVENRTLPVGVLMPGEPVTTNLKAFTGGSYSSVVSLSHDPKQILVSYLDVALIAYFTPSWVPFWHRHTVFRFRTIRTSDGIILRQVPAEGIESEFNKIRNLSP